MEKWKDEDKFFLKEDKNRKKDDKKKGLYYFLSNNDCFLTMMVMKYTLFLYKFKM